MDEDVAQLRASDQETSTSLSGWHLCGGAERSNK
jgi:hypothetical protein